MPTVYVETTVPSYLAARPSRDLITAAHQQITQRWWNAASQRFNLFVSDAVLSEISAGDPDAAARRLTLIANIDVLRMNSEVRSLAHAYQQAVVLPRGADVDILHLAFAVAYELDYLVTWNCAHIANGEVVRHLVEVNRQLERPTPIILTPEGLLEGPSI